MSFNDLESQVKIPTSENYNDVNQKIITLVESLKLLKRDCSKIGTSTDSIEVRQKIETELIPKTLILTKSIEEIDLSNNDRTSRMFLQIKEDLQLTINNYRKNKSESPLIQKSNNNVVLVEEADNNGNSYISMNLHTNQESDPLLPQRQKQLSLQQTDDQQLIDEAELSYQSIIQQERSQEISKIKGKVTEVNAIFKQLSTLVKEQGTNIDSIDNNISSLTRNLQASNKQLDKANENQRSKNKCSMVVLIILIVIVLIIILGILS
ncbi:hypothetical protein Kpol_1029p5 [Vanderwaltozyma polyspora DSM 70294]|uniref:t-SNARE coiled-coil homology domain-containing protein n=1 Tax=Vanderwaltozyma polyspora (strain ATCC 22028 / DSM 70294 / BCRC 21397 / CBS 2163 / NBRC 10782 / NRRL Y-8283 / UCD 57-17) TaxID=436907 RepID=A7TR64_VANPO|nr:uncharacterized protein Kpol_1029p5 [Vanderwaltozyma polyspora DSM 70294]EDO15232.1 hypothetical protein Kpol_1029p5 [Vanderwaltozyma polyspora DSM 70294]